MARPRPYLHASPPRLTSRGTLPTYDQNGQPLIRLQTLGAAVIMVGDVRLSAAAGTLFSLLVRLTGAPGMMLSRDVLRRSLWPDQEEVRQRANLRQGLYKLRGFGVRVSMQGDVVILDESQVVHSFARDRTTDTFERDVTLGHEPFGPFLPGFVVPWPELQEWIAEQREAVHADVRRVLVEQLRSRRDRADWGGAQALARWLLQFDPLNEEATLTMAECAALSGSKTEALSILDKYLAELGPTAGDIRLPATMLRKRIAEPPSRSRRSFAPTERHFVGRDAELASLTLSMRRARWHDGSAVLLHGPPGIGKSRLAHELDKVATIEGVRVVQATCRESDMQRPLSVFLDVLPDVMAASGALGCAPESLTALRRLVPTSALSSVSLESVPGTREPMPMASSLRRAIIDLLSAVSDEKPMMLLVEDVHWIDEHSWDVLADLIDRASAMRVFVLLTSRESHARMQRPQRVPLALQVQRIPPLSADSCLLLSRAIGEDLAAPVDDALGEWFVQASEGIPLFLRALVNHWIETGEAGGVPPTLQGVIEQRLSQLSGDALRVLQTAALLGKWATAERVQGVLEHSTSAFLGHVVALENDGMLVASHSASLRCHDLTALAALARLRALSRATLQRRIAHVLERELDRTSHSDLLLNVLHHHSEARDFRSLLRLCARRAAHLSAWWQPSEILRLLESIDSGSIAEADSALRDSLCSRLRVESGLYGAEVAVRGGSDRLPVAGSRISRAQADEGLSIVDSAYRADLNADRDQLADYTISVTRLTHLPKSTRLRSAGIGFVILSNLCDSVRAQALWVALERGQMRTTRSFDFRRVALLYHTIFGDLTQADELATSMLLRAVKNPQSFFAPADALRAGFALRIASYDSGYLQAFKFAYSTATSLQLPAYAMNAAWQLAQSHLDLGQRTECDHWSAILQQLHEADSDRVSSSFVPALLCRRAIECDDQETARSHYESFAAAMPSRPTIRNRVHAVALRFAIELIDAKWTPSPHQIAEIRGWADTVMRFGGADFLACTLIRLLARTDGRAAEAQLISYLKVLRRERGSLSTGISRLVEAVR